MEAFGNSIVKFAKDIVIEVLVGLLFSLVIRRLIISAVHLYKKKPHLANKTIFDKFFYGWLCGTVIMCLIMVFKDEEPEDIWNLYKILTCLTISALVPVIHSLLPWFGVVNDLDLVNVQSVKKSIGAMWALGAYKAYYEIIFKELSEKIEDYENSGNSLDLKKLILVCPLSCNIEGKLSEKFENIEDNGVPPLPPIEYDQGANVNRCYKLPVYRVYDTENVYNLLIQLPSSLGTLWQARDLLTEDIWLYHRSCFIETLKELLKNSPCSFVIYDDSTNHEPLYKYLISELKLKKEK